MELTMLYLFLYKKTARIFKLKVLLGNLLQPTDTFTERQKVLSNSSSKQGFRLLLAFHQDLAMEGLTLSL